jgi:hypothetical protein
MTVSGKDPADQNRIRSNSHKMQLKTQNWLGFFKCPNRPRRAHSPLCLFKYRYRVKSGISVLYNVASMTSPRLTGTRAW